MIQRQAEEIIKSLRVGQKAECVYRGRKINGKVSEGAHRGIIDLAAKLKDGMGSTFAFDTTNFTNKSITSFIVEGKELVK
jgi:hypothetical protein